MTHFYASDTWIEWCRQECENYESIECTEGKKNVYLKKGYLHFDSRFWFPELKHEIENIVSDPKNFSSWSFFPFIKNIVKTHRFKKENPEGRPKRKSKERPICYAAHKDALIYGYCSYSLTKVYERYIHENKFSDAVFAYRTDLNGDCNIQFAKQVFSYIRNRGECTAIALDITGFFDNLNHNHLKEKWAKVIGEDRLPQEHFKLYKTLTQFAHTNIPSLLEYLNVDLNKAKPFPKSLLSLFPEGQHAGLFRQLRERGVIQIQKHKGIPQGSPMSAVLSNIYMIDFDEQLNALSNEENFLYRRYCDDILIVCSNDLVIKIKQIVYELIEKYELDIQPEKAEEILFKFDSHRKLRSFNLKKIQKYNQKFNVSNQHYFYKPLQYLGFEFNGQDILIRSSSLCRYQKKLRRRINKSVKMAYSDNAVSDKVFTKTTYYRYSHLGKRNFVSYALRCASAHYENSIGESKEGMDSPKIRRQVSRHMQQIRTLIAYKNLKRYEQKLQRKDVRLKRV